MTPLRPAWLSRPIKSLLVYGGSFDPVHNTHLSLPQSVREKVGADMIGYVPAANAPHKQGRDRTPSHHRLAMLRLALAGSPNCVLLTHEIDRAADGRPSYTVDTLEQLSVELGPDVRLMLLMGADMLGIFHKWYRYQRILELAEPVVMLRPPFDAPALLNALSPELDRDYWSGRIVKTQTSPISSTEIRGLVAAGKPIDHLVPAGVAAYIREHGLYRRTTG
jgi:nicotinate-nucleotide adenylyltransferase